MFLACRFSRDIGAVAALPPMRRISGVAAVAASALLSGCFLIPQSGPEEDTRGGFHDVTINWRMLNLDGTPMSACPPGYTTIFAHLYVQGLVEPEDAFLQLPCTAQGSLTQPVATSGRLMDPATKNLGAHAYWEYTGQKDFWLDVTEETGNSYAARSFVRYVENLSSDQTIDFDIYPEGGVAVAAWELDSTLTGAPLASCASAGVDEIEFAYRVYTDTNAPLVVAAKWPCTAVDPDFYFDPDGSRLLDPNAPGNYNLGSGHTKGIAPEAYFVELRAKRAGVIVGRSMSVYHSEKGNIPRRVQNTEIPIDDR